MNRIKALFASKQENILNIYFTAGHPTKDSTVKIILALEKAGVDLIEIGIPYSDPMADGETIQLSSAAALKNGMNLQLLFSQIAEARQHTQIPIVLMGYYNQLLQFGELRFLEHCKKSGVDALILPDLPLDIYERDYAHLFDRFDLSISFLVTPETSDERIRQADRLSTAFLYIVSKSSITGNKSDISDTQELYFDRLASLQLISPPLIGFGIHDFASFKKACQYAKGAIVGSAFIRAIEGWREETLVSEVSTFVMRLRQEPST